MPWLPAHIMRWMRATVVASMVAAPLGIATDAGAKPNVSQLRDSARDLLNVEVAPNPCDDVWQFLDKGSAPMQTPTAVVSIRQAYAVAGLSTLADVRPDDYGRYALNAPLMLGSTAELGRVDVRFGRHPGPDETGYRYSVQVKTCEGGTGCGRVTTHTHAPLECSAERDSATLVVPGASASQEVRIRFRR